MSQNRVKIELILSTKGTIKKNPGFLGFFELKNPIKPNLGFFELKNPIKPNLGFLLGFFFMPTLL